MKKVNPLWGESKFSEIDNENEKAVSYLCDPIKWQSYCDSNFEGYAIGGVSLEIFTEAYNIYEGKSSPLLPTIIKSNGYSLGYNGSFNWGGDGGVKTPDGSLETGINYIFLQNNRISYLSSPSAWNSIGLWITASNYLDGCYRTEASNMYLQPLACVF